MSTFKVSYDLLRQQSEALKSLAKKVDVHGEDLTSVSGQLSVNTAFTDLQGDLKKLGTQLDNISATINACGVLLGTIGETYQNSEVTVVKRAQETRVYQRDVYKNPVVIVVHDSGSDTSAGGYASSANYGGGTGYNSGAGAAYSGGGGEAYTATATNMSAGSEGATTSTISSGDFSTGSGTGQTDGNVTNIFVNTPESGGMGAGAAAAVGAGGAAVGAAAAMGAKKVMEKIKGNSDKENTENKSEATKTVISDTAPKASTEFIDPEIALAEARKKLAEVSN